MAVYGYARVSTEHQVQEGVSLDVQARQLTAWGMHHGRDLDETFVERGVSGSIPLRERPEGARLWSLLKRGDTVVSNRLDRMFRSSLDTLQTVEAFQKRKVDLWLLDIPGQLVTGNGLSKVVLTLCAAFAEEERRKAVERITTVKADQKARGRYLGGIVPFGYRLIAGELVEEPAEQEIIRDIKARRNTGESFRAISADAETRYGRKLGLKTVFRLAGE